MKYESIRKDICAVCEEKFTCGMSDFEIDDCFHMKFPLEMR